MNFMDIWQEIQGQLNELDAKDLLRKPTIVDSACGAHVTVAGREIVCFCSNDYLSLAADPAVKKAARDAIDKWGLGSGASRLVSGTSTLHVELEQTIADFKCTESAVVAPTGWMANQIAITALVTSDDLVLADKLNHASIIDAVRASGAKLRTYAHCNASRLRSLLQKHRSQYKRCLIVTDSLFSMDGDLAPLTDLVALKHEFDAQLLIDEAHATGVLGSSGRGVAELAGVEDQIDVTVGTLSKAVGSLGGFIAGRDVLIEKIRNTARPFIYTTALPPALCAGAIESLRIIRSEPHRRQRVLSMASELKAALAVAGFDVGLSQSQIIPVIVGDAGEAMRMSRQLLAEGFLVPAIRPPTVAPGTSRLRVSVCAGHSSEDIAGLVDAMASAGGGA